MSSATSIAPPTGYPHEAWTDDESDQYYVPAELRADYAEAFATIDGYVKWVTHQGAAWRQNLANTSDFVAPPFELWAHRTRLGRARQAVHSREWNAEWQRTHLRPCPCCRQRSEFAYWKTVRAPAVPRGQTFRVCYECWVLLEPELHAARTLGDTGRTRGEVVAEYAATLMELWAKEDAP